MEISRELYEDLKSESFNLRTDYSGRGMNGKECIALTGNVRDLVRFALRVAEFTKDDEDDDDDRAGWVEYVRVDSMGLDQIYYWTSVTVKKEGD